MLKYRPEIDGLRTIAVLSVLIYHAELFISGHQLLRGGFLGVDIFFVISGYLITSIILKEINGDGFSYARFYERRARRLLPALIVVLIVTTIGAVLILGPSALKEYAGSVVSSLFFTSNIWFWMQDAYTAEPSRLKPLLHTWTLSVEEQFYIIFPIIVMLVVKFRKDYLLPVRSRWRCKLRPSSSVPGYPPRGCKASGAKATYPASAVRRATSRICGFRPRFS